MQIFDVAFSRRICCSRVCNARRRAGRPASSTLTPTSRPGIERASFSETAINAAWGPPPPIGTPNRCAEPIAMSAPIEPAERRSTAARGQCRRHKEPPCDGPSRLPTTDHGYRRSTMGKRREHQILHRAQPGWHRHRTQPRFQWAQPVFVERRGFVDEHHDRQKTRLPFSSIGDTSSLLQLPLLPRRVARRWPQADQ